LWIFVYGGHTGRYDSGSAIALSAITVVAPNLIYAMERCDFIFFCGMIGAALEILSGFILLASLIPGAGVGLVSARKRF